MLQVVNNFEARQEMNTQLIEIIVIYSTVKYKCTSKQILSYTSKAEVPESRTRQVDLQDKQIYKTSRFTRQVESQDKQIYKTSRFTIAQDMYIDTPESSCTK